MTLTGRNRTIRTTLIGCFIITGISVFLFIRVVAGIGSIETDLEIDRLFAVSSAFLSVALGFLFAVLYVRLFRRSPSIPVFFVTLFFLSMTLDIFKVGQVIIESGLWPQFSPLVSRVTIFGHTIGIFALFAAGLYSGGVRMQRHGTVVIVGTIIALSLSILLPVDTSALPVHLVYPAGVRASFEIALIVIMLLSVINFIQAAVVNQNPRLFVSALAVLLLAVGRELLFYFPDPILIIAGGSSVIVGGVIFTGEHYRDYLVS